MATALSWLTRIYDIGVAQQDFVTIRRIRSINILAFVAMSVSLSYGIFFLVFDRQHFREEIVVSLVFGALYFAVFQLSQRGRLDAAMWLVTCLGLIHVGLISWLLGAESGALSYLILLPVIMSMLLREGDRVSVWPVVFAANAIIAIVAFSGEGSLSTLPKSFRNALFLSNLLSATAIATGVVLYYRWLIQMAETELEQERFRSDRLLHAILPGPIAEELKANDKEIVAERFELWLNLGDGE